MGLSKVCRFYNIATNLLRWPSSESFYQRQTSLKSVLFMQNNSLKTFLGLEFHQLLIKKVYDYEQTIFFENSIDTIYNIFACNFYNYYANSLKKLNLYFHMEINQEFSTITTILQNIYHVSVLCTFNTSKNTNQ